MPRTETTTVKWECDRCHKIIVSDKRPSSPLDSWGTLMIDQSAGFDYQGMSWAPRMRKPILLCGACIEEIVKVVNNETN